jgi:hypothetical protein
MSRNYVMFYIFLAFNLHADSVFFLVTIRRALTKRSGGLLFPSFLIISITALPKPDGHLFKIGRTTEVTWGRYSGIGESIFKSWSLDSNGQRIEVVGPEQTAVGRPVPYVNDFGKPGDSGAFVFDGAGSLVGLYWGG